MATLGGTDHRQVESGSRKMSSDGGPFPDTVLQHYNARPQGIVKLKTHLRRVVYFANSINYLTSSAEPYGGVISVGQSYS